MTREFSEKRHNHPEVRMEHLKHLIGQPIAILEIGVWEGESTCWLLDNILTHPDARIVTVDPFEYVRNPSTSEEKEELEQYAKGNFNHASNIVERFFDNVGLENAKKLAHFHQFSDDFFSTRDLAAFDVAIVDGAHNAFQVAKDLLNCWEFLKPNGILIADDYGWQGHDAMGGWRSNGPHRAIDAFMGIIPEKDREVLHLDWLAIFKKTFAG